MGLTELMSRLIPDDPVSAVPPAGIEANPPCDFFAFVAGSLVAVFAAVSFVFHSREVASLEVTDDSLAAAPGDGKTIWPTIASSLVGVGVTVTFTGVFFPNPSGSEGLPFIVIGAFTLFKGIAGPAPFVARRFGTPPTDSFLRSLGGGCNRIRLAFHDVREQGVGGRFARAAMTTLLISTFLLSSAAITTGVAYADALAVISASFLRDVDMC